MRLAPLATVADDSRTMLSRGLAPLTRRSFRRCRSPYGRRPFLRERRGPTGALGCSQESLITREHFDAKFGLIEAKMDKISWMISAVIAIVAANFAKQFF